jgi:uncharacterized protein (TIGR02217 family)
MSNAVFPGLIGEAYPVTRRAIFSTRVQRSVSGREVRIADYPYPIWEWTLAFDYLALADRATLVGFVAARQGSYDSFLFSDASDNTVTGQAIATGDGTTTAFQLVRTLGVLVEPILAPNVVSAVTLNGVNQPSGWSVDSATGILTFTSAPASGTAIAADFTYRFRCRFVDDGIETEQFMNNFWRAKQIRFRSLFL